MTRRDTAPARRRWRSSASSRVHCILFVAAAAASAVGCGGSETPDAAVVVEPQWWQPKYGDVKDWDIQLNMPFDLSAPHKMYVIDLWDAVPLDVTLAYGSGTDTLTVKAGRLAGRITELHARTPASIVICYIESGIIETGIPELESPDASKFLQDGVRGNKVPDLLGSTLAGTPSGYFLNTSAASRAIWAPILFKRFDLARQIGCDGIAPGHNDVGAYPSEVTGFTVSSDETTAWYTEVAKQAHDRMLSVGMLGGERLTSLYEQEADNYDWMLVERCGEISGCDFSAPFNNAGKSVLALEYTTSAGDQDKVPPEDPKPQIIKELCTNEVRFVVEGLGKDVKLSSDVREPCEPDAPSTALRR